LPSKDNKKKGGGGNNTTEYKPFTERWKLPSKNMNFGKYVIHNSHTCLMFTTGGRDSPKPTSNDGWVTAGKKSVPIDQNKLRSMAKVCL
jgi:hypothetical protein